MKKLILAFIFLLLVPYIAAADPNHPFLIVAEPNYPALRALTSQSPWSNMKADAIKDVQNLVYNPADDYSTKVNRMNDIVGAGALAYILDPNNSSTYVSKLYSTMMNWSDLRAGLDKGDWSHTVPPGSPFFQSVLTLDIIYNDLTPSQRSDIEAELQQVAD